MITLQNWYAKRRKATAMHLQNYILLLISRSTVLPINMYVKDPYLAQDILQEVYILVLKNLDTLKNPRLFVSWLHQITFRICFDTWQKRKRQEQELDYISSGQASDFSESFSDVMTNPEKHILNKDAKARLMQAIQSLPPQYSQAIIMRYYNNMNIEDIAVAMDYSRSTAKRRLRKGRKLLENMLHEEKGGICFE